MSDQANDYQRRINQIGGGGMQQGVGQLGYNSIRLAKVWVAYRDYGLEGKGDPIAVFPTKALADIFQAGADASMTATVKIAELPINYGG